MSGEIFGLRGPVFADRVLRASVTFFIRAAKTFGYLVVELRRSFSFYSFNGRDGALFLYSCGQCGHYLFQLLSYQTFILSIYTSFFFFETKQNTYELE